MSRNSISNSYLPRVLNDYYEEFAMNAMNANDSENFTQLYLTQFAAIEWQTIDALLNNGYRTREALMAFDLKEDLPLLTNVNMAQKSLLRKALQKLMPDEELAVKADDIKERDIECDNDLQRRAKRKRVVADSPFVTKRTRNADYLMSDIEMSEPINTSSRQSTSAAKLDSQRTPFVSKFFKERANNISPVNDRRNNSVDKEESWVESSSDECDNMRTPERRSTASRGANLARPQTNESLTFARKTDVANRRSSTRSTATPKVEPNNAKSNGKPGNAIPTPTEIELREHLARQKFLGKTRGRKSIK